MVLFQWLPLPSRFCNFRAMIWLPIYFISGVLACDTRAQRLEHMNAQSKMLVNTRAQSRWAQRTLGPGHPQVEMKWSMMRTTHWFCASGKVTGGWSLALPHLPHPPLCKLQPVFPHSSLFASLLSISSRDLEQDIPSDFPDPSDKT